MRTWCQHMAVWATLGSLLLVGSATSSRAGEPTDKVRETVDAALAILADEALKAPERTQERRAKIRQAVLQRFGFEEMSRRSLGIHWQKLTPQERQEFVQLFTDLLERSYIEKIEGYSGNPKNIRYTKETIDKDGYASVRSGVVNQRDMNVDIEYRLLQRDGNWEAYDIVIEGVSLVNNYRTQFNKIIQEGSYANLLKQMKLKLEQEKAGTGTKN